MCLKTGNLGNLLQLFDKQFVIISKIFPNRFQYFQYFQISRFRSYIQKPRL